MNNVKLCFIIGKNGRSKTANTDDHPNAYPSPVSVDYLQLCYGTLRYSSGIPVGLVDWGGISGISGIVLLLAVGFY